jgi:hypothetical protein
MINIKKDKLPENARKGDAILIEGDQIRIDAGKTTRQKKETKELMDDLWK